MRLRSRRCVCPRRYDHLVIEYLRTAQRLQYLRQDHLANPASDPAAFIDACEAAISVEPGLDGPLEPTWPRHRPGRTGHLRPTGHGWRRAGCDTPVQALPVPARRRRSSAVGGRDKPGEATAQPRPQGRSPRSRDSTAREPKGGRARKGAHEPDKRGRSGIGDGSEHHVRGQAHPMRRTALFLWRAAERHAQVRS